MYQVGRPWMLLGNRFLPTTGIPILKKARSNTPLLVWLPDPLIVAMFSEKLLITAGRSATGIGASCTAILIPLLLGVVGG